MWHEVEILLDEMEAFGIPLQESVVISVLNVCRGQSAAIKSNMESSSGSGSGSGAEFDLSMRGSESIGITSSSPTSSSSQTSFSAQSSTYIVNDMRSKVTTCQWARTLWLIENYGLRATNVTESMYTMAMDVCESNLRLVSLTNWVTE